VRYRPQTLEPDLGNASAGSSVVISSSGAVSRFIDEPARRASSPGSL